MNEGSDSAVVRRKDLLPVGCALNLSWTGAALVTISDLHIPMCLILCFESAAGNLHILMHESGLHAW